MLSHLRPIWLWIFALGISAGSGTPARGEELPADQPDLLRRIDRALERGAAFLVDQQSGEGAWRSDGYAPFKHGDALTPAVLAALVELPEAERPLQAIELGFDYLNGMISADGTVVPPESGMAYPVYTAAGALQALTRRTDARSLSARRAWLDYLRERQLAEINGWSDGDPFYGGWGYDPGIPKKPVAGAIVGPLTEPNLSATVYALEGLRAAGMSAGTPERQAARRFIARCQNYSSPGKVKSLLDDGGFFFLQSDVVRNKAGAAGSGTHGEPRFASYGSATADGLRALLLAGAAPDDPRVQAGWNWLRANFNAEVHPGRFAEGRAPERDSVYFYYCHSLARLLREDSGGASRVGLDSCQAATELAQALVARQGPDGAWRNPAVEVREDDPIVASVLALASLANCRALLLSKSKALGR